MIKLKTILTEGFAWERKEGKGLPTMAEVKAEYDAKQLKENAGDLFDEIADELGLTPEEFDAALDKSRAELDGIERLYNSDSLTRTEALGQIADMLDVPFGYYKYNESANANQSGDSYESMSDSQLMAAAEDAGMEEMIIMGSDGLVNSEELIDLLNAESEYADDEVDDDGYPVMDGGRPSGSSREVDEASGAKPDFLDLDKDGNEKESMKSAANSSSHGNYINKARAKSHLAKKDGSVYGIDGSGKGHKITNASDLDKYRKWTIKSESMTSTKNEAVGQEDADIRWNDPIQMGMRDISKPTTTSSIKAPSNFYREKLVSLKAQRKQIEFDMEQEAEPEGGPIADYYGEALQSVDDQIDAITQKMNTNESIEEATGEDGRTETISAKRATAELKQKLAGKRSDGMGAYTSTIYGVDASGKKVKLTSLNDITKFKTFGITEKEPRWQDNDGDGKWYEPGVDVKENVNESFIGRLKKNLLGGAVRK
jgi:hypothetical protein